MSISIFNLDPDKTSLLGAFQLAALLRSGGHVYKQQETSPDWKGSLLPEKRHVA